MTRAPVFALLVLTLVGCGPAGKQRTAAIPQADTPPDPPAELASAASSLPSDAVLAASGSAPREQ